MTHYQKPFAMQDSCIFSTSDLSRRWRITLLVLRILVLVGAVAFLIMGIVADRSYMIWFVSGLAIILLIIPELTTELLIRDFFRSGIYNVSHKIRLIVSPLIYGVVYAVSPLLFHAFFNLFAAHSRTMGGNVTSLQIGIWRTLYNPPPITFPTVILIITGAVFLLFTMLGLCYLTLSKSKWRRLAAVILFILLEAASALAACNSPG